MTARVRLHVFLAHAGVASRRAAERLMREGRVQVNGETATAPGTTVDPARDRVTADGREVQVMTEVVVLAMNKPRGVLTAARDARGRRTVVGLLPEDLPRTVPVGRLDLQSEGLLLLTNDGELALRLSHPRYGVTKRYAVLPAQPVTAEQLRRLRGGVDIGEERPAAARTARRCGRPARHYAEGDWFEIELHEGRKHVVRRMCEAVGLRVLRLVRTAVDGVALSDLAPSQWRRLRAAEVEALRAACGLGAPASPRPVGGLPPPARGQAPDGGRGSGGSGPRIAIDGPAASGKTAIGSRVARALGLAFLDTGALYRAVTWWALRNHVPPEDRAGVAGLLRDLRLTVGTRPARDDPEALQTTVHIDGADATAHLRDRPVEAGVSLYSALPAVRRHLLALQRRFAARGAVLAGRDIGTVVLPDADVKVFLEAKLEVRRARRGETAAEQEERDRIDASRSAAPLRPAPDAVIIDTSSLTIGAVVSRVLDIVTERVS